MLMIWYDWLNIKSALTTIFLALEATHIRTEKDASIVDSFRLPPMSWLYSVDHLPHHATFNKIIKRHFLFQLEPARPDLEYGKRPDGRTIFPFRGGRSLTWYVICTDNSSGGNLVLSASKCRLRCSSSWEKDFLKISMAIQQVYSRARIGWELQRSCPCSRPYLNSPLLVSQSCCSKPSPSLSSGEKPWEKARFSVNPHNLKLPHLVLYHNLISLS